MHLENKKILRILGSWLRLFYGAKAPGGPGSPHYRGFEITHRHMTVGRTPLDESSAPRRDLYLRAKISHNKRETSMLAVRFEPTIPSSERWHTHTLDRATTGIGWLKCYTGQKGRKPKLNEDYNNNYNYKNYYYYYYYYYYNYYYYYYNYHYYC